MKTALGYLAYGVIAAVTLFCVGAVVGYHAQQAWRDLKARRRRATVTRIDAWQTRQYERARNTRGGAA